MTLRQQIGALIKDARKAKGLQQEDLAAMLGIKQSEVSNLEQGKVSVLKNAELAIEKLGIHVILVDANAQLALDKIKRQLWQHASNEFMKDV